MKEMARYGFILASICIVASSSLAIVNSITRPIIIALAKAEEEASLRQVMPEAQSFAAVKSAEDEVIYYKALDKDAKIIGAAFKAQAKGYSSIIEAMVGLKADGTITAIKILNQNETPGLGTRITEPSFLGQFSNKNMENFKEVSAITGATVSSKAVIDSVKKKAQEIITAIKNEE